MKKTIAIIGVEGIMGPAMVHGFAKVGYRTLVTHYDEEGLADLTGKIPLLVSKIRLEEPHADIEVASSAREASWEADIVVPTVPYNLQAAVASRIKDVVTGKIVISAINPINETLDGLLTPPTTSAAEELARLLPHSKVVEAFNTIFAVNFDAPEFIGQAVDVFVAGDDDEAVSTVAQLVRDLGLIPLRAGKLSMSRTLENMMVLLISLSLRNHFLKPVGWKVVHDKVVHTEQDGLETSKIKTERSFPCGKDG